MRPGRRFLVLLFTVSGLLLTPYALTAFTSNSTCFPEGRIVGAQEKIIKAKRWLIAKGSVVADQLNCCEVGKGGDGFPPIGLSAYLLHDKVHYVFIAKYQTARAANGLYRLEHWNVVTVDSCGNPMLEGMDF